MNFISNILTNNFTIILLLFSLTIISACEKEDSELIEAQDLLEDFLINVDQNQLEAELAVIDDSLASWGLTSSIQIEPNGTRYKIDSPGDGKKPKLNDNIRFSYSGKLLNGGTEFDSGENLDAILYYLIAGFQTTLPLIEEGAVFSLYIPSVYGYGATDRKDANGNVIIPKNSNLIFDVELKEVD